MARGKKKWQTARGNTEEREGLLLPFALLCMQIRD